MVSETQLSRCAFAVIKLKIGQVPFVFMRRDRTWNDLNLIGGHQNQRDRRSYSNTVRREVREEIPILRKGELFEVCPLTELVSFGPVYSKSRLEMVEYEVVYFLVKFLQEPAFLRHAISGRTDNVLVRQSEIGLRGGHRISRMALQLEHILVGGWELVEYSWSRDLKEVKGFDRFPEQDELPFEVGKLA